MDTVRVAMPKYFRVSLLKNNVGGEKESKNLIVLIAFHEDNWFEVTLELLKNKLQSH